MTDIRQSALFQPWTDPESRVTSYVLSHRIAPVQKPNYFVNRSLSTDGRYLWFQCAFPPSPHMSLAVADVHEGTVTHCPETAGTHSYMVDDETGGAYFTARMAVWYRGPRPSDAPDWVNAIPDDLTRGRTGRLVSHLTTTPDRRAFFVDAKIGEACYVGMLPKDGSAFEHWQTLHGNYNHGQCCPTDGGLALMAKETGISSLEDRKPHENRMWLVKEDGTVAPIFPVVKRTPENEWRGHDDRMSHEWWSSDGQWACFVGSHGVEHPSATYRTNVLTGKTEMLWKEWHWHAHDWDNGRYLVGDRRERGNFFRGCASSVHFCNNDTGREVAVVSHNPENIEPGRHYHIDPHPSFSPDGALVVYTTTVLGTIDVALAVTADLLERT